MKILAVDNYDALFDMDSDIDNLSQVSERYHNPNNVVNMFKDIPDTIVT